MFWTDSLRIGTRFVKPEIQTSLSVCTDSHFWGLGVRHLFILELKLMSRAELPEHSVPERMVMFGHSRAPTRFRGCHIHLLFQFSVQWSAYPLTAIVTIVIFLWARTCSPTTAWISLTHALRSSSLSAQKMCRSCPPRMTKLNSLCPLSSVNTCPSSGGV